MKDLKPVSRTFEKVDNVTYGVLKDAIYDELLNHMKKETARTLTDAIMFAIEVGAPF